VLRLKLATGYCSGRCNERVSLSDEVSGALRWGSSLPSVGRLRLFGCLMVTDNPVTGSIFRGGYVQLEFTRQLKDQEGIAVRHPIHIPRSTSGMYDIAFAPEYKPAVVVERGKALPFTPALKAPFPATGLLVVKRFSCLFDVGARRCTRHPTCVK
jgi:hypothetical protein